MKVIFLDIDGVLNVIPQGYDKHGGIFHPEFTENLRTIIDQTGAKIVISSTWRMSGLTAMQNLWSDRGLSGEVIDITPIARWDTYTFNEDDPRGAEIKNWLLYNEIERYVIIDDDTDFLDNQLNNFVQTSNNPDHPDSIDIGYGLTKICAEKAINILNK